MTENSINKSEPEKPKEIPDMKLIWRKESICSGWGQQFTIPAGWRYQHKDYGAVQEGRPLFIKGKNNG